MPDKIKDLSIRGKIIATFSIIALLIFCFLYIFSKDIILGNYSILETERQERNIKRYENIIANSINNLSIKVSDWAVWDDSYNFVKNKNRAYIDSNMGNSTFSSLEINGIFFLNNKGDVVFSKMYDVNNEEEVFSDEFDEVIEINKDDFLFKNTEEYFSGFIKTDKEVLIFVAKPILKSDNTGPISGTIIFTKSVDDVFWSKIEDLVQYKMEIFEYNSDSIPVQVKEHIDLDNEYFIDLSKEEFVYGYFYIYDVYQKPISVVKIIIPNDIYQRGETSFYFFVTISFVFILIFIVLIYLLFETLVFKRIIRVNKDVVNIDTSGNINERVKILHPDEIGDLVLSINNLLDEISVTREREGNYVALEKKAKDDLEKKVDEVQKLNKLMVGRELKMLELKSEIDKLKKS